MRRTVNHGYDNMGQQPKAGDLVAYNYSGEVAVGRIERLGGRVIHIRQIYPKFGHHSQVRGGSRCVLVLTEDQRARILRDEQAHNSSIPF